MRTVIVSVCPKCRTLRRVREIVQGSVRADPQGDDLRPFVAEAILGGCGHRTKDRFSGRQLVMLYGKRNPKGG